MAHTLLIMGIETIVIYGLYALTAIVAVSAYMEAKRLKKTGSGTTTMIQSATQARQIIYGRRRIGGIEVFIFTNGTNNEYLNFILALCDGPIQQVEELWFDNVKCPLAASGAGWVPTGTVLNSDGTYSANPWIGHVYVEYRLGTLDQTALAIGVDPSGHWGETDKMVGVACAWVQMKYDTTVFANGVPNISFVCKGRNDIWDPRLPTTSGDPYPTAYTDNPALCQNHYVMLPDLGPGLSVNEIGVDELIAAANICDEIVPTKPSCASRSGYVPQKRYTFDGVISMDDSAEDIINNFIASMAGTRVYSGGKWRVYAGAWVEPTFTVDKSILIANVTASTRTSKINRVNQVFGTFTLESNNWQATDYPAYEKSDFVTDDGGPLPNQVDFDWANTIPLARRLAKINLMRSRFSGTCSIKTDVNGLRCEAGLPILLYIPELGYVDPDNSAKGMPMLVVTWQWSVGSDGAIEISMDLQQVDPSIWDWDPELDDDKCDNATSPPIGVIPRGPVPIPGGGGGGGNPGRYPDLLPSPAVYGYAECRMKTCQGSFCGFKEEDGQESDPPRFYKDRTKVGTISLKEYNNSGCSDGGGSSSGQLNPPDYDGGGGDTATGYVTWYRLNNTTLRFTGHCSSTLGTPKIHIGGSINNGGDPIQYTFRDGETWDRDLGYFSNEMPVTIWSFVGRYNYGDQWGAPSSAAPGTTVVCYSLNCQMHDTEDTWNLEDDYRPHLATTPPTCAITETDTSTKTIDGVPQGGGPSESDFPAGTTEVTSLTATLRTIAGTESCIQKSPSPLRYQKASGEMTETLSQEDTIDDVIKRALAETSPPYATYDDILSVPDSELDPVVDCQPASNHGCCHAYVSLRTGTEKKDVFIREGKVKLHAKPEDLIEGHSYTLTAYFYRRNYGTGDFVYFSNQAKDFTASADDCVKGYASPLWYRIPNDDGYETIVDRVELVDTTS